MLMTIRQRFLLSLQYRDYRVLWTATVCAGAAAWALIVARGWLAFTITDSSLWAGLVTFVAMAPRFFATPVIGFLADRFDRQTLLCWTYALNLSHNVALAALAMLGLADPWVLVALSLINGTLRAAEQTVTQSLLPNLIPKDHLLNAVALNQATQQGSRLVGPLAIAPLLAFLNVEAAFWLCSAFYAVGLVQVLRVNTRSRGIIDRRRSLSRNLVAGFEYVYQQPMVLAMVLLAVAHCSLTMSFESMLPALSAEKLGGGSAGVSYLMSAVGAGALTSAILLAGVRNRATRGRLFFILGIASGLTPIMVGFSAQTEVSLAAAAAMGASEAGFVTITHAIIQSIVPDEIRGRVSGIYSMHVGSTMALANLTNGTMSDVFNAPMVIMVGGSVFTIIMFLSLAHSFLRSIYFPRVAETARAA
jgi:MFS family permease